MFRKASMAWITLGQNGTSDLYILWEEARKKEEVVKYDERDGNFYRIYTDGTVDCGYYTKEGELLSASGSIINSIFSINTDGTPSNSAPSIVDVHVFEPDDGGIHRTMSITKELCEKILKDFSLYFHLIKRNWGNSADSSGCISYILEQDEREKMQGEVTEDKTGKKFAIVKPTWTGLFSDIEGYMVVPVSKGNRGISITKTFPVMKTYNDLPYIYQGTDWAIIMAFIHGWFHDTTWNGR